MNARLNLSLDLQILVVEHAKLPSINIARLARMEVIFPFISLHELLQLLLNFWLFPLFLYFGKANIFSIFQMYGGRSVLLRSSVVIQCFDSFHIRQSGVRLLVELYFYLFFFL